MSISKDRKGSGNGPAIITQASGKSQAGPLVPVHIDRPGGAHVATALSVLRKSRDGITARPPWWGSADCIRSYTGDRSHNLTLAHVSCAKDAPAGANRFISRSG
jgi:hypothetical protein